MKSDALKRAFQVIDVDKDGHITYDDFHNLFNTHDKYAGRRFDRELWEELLREAG